jgi:type VI secretion system protein ImpM
MLPASRARLGARWLEAWMVAPVWRFELAPDVCGPDAATGVMMPSTDRAGRHFPLTIAMIGDLAQRAVEGWLDHAENAGREALESIAAPDVLMAQLCAAGGLERTTDEADSGEDRMGGSRWWSEGSPFVAATRFSLARLPDADTFTAMLSAPEGAQ